MSNLWQNFSNVFLVIVLCVCVRNSFQTDPLGEATTTENLEYTHRTYNPPSANKGTNGKVKPPTMLGELPTTGDENISENLQYTHRPYHLPSANKGDENISENLQFTHRTYNPPSANKGTNGNVKPPSVLRELPTTETSTAGT